MNAFRMALAGNPNVDSTEGLAKSASTSSTSLFRSAAIATARFVAQKVFPSPGSGEQISTRRALAVPAALAEESN